MLVPTAGCDNFDGKRTVLMTVVLSVRVFARVEDLRKSSRSVVPLANATPAADLRAVLRSSGVKTENAFVRAM